MGSIKRMFEFMQVIFHINISCTKSYKSKAFELALNKQIISYVYKSIADILAQSLLVMY